MSWIDDANDTIRTTINNLSANPCAIAVNPVTNKVYVTNLANNTVSMIDVDINALSTSGPGRNPFGGGSESGNQQNLCNQLQ